MDLWDQVGPCFDTDDGSLPGIEISGLSPAEVAAVYARLRSISHVEEESPEFWCKIEGRSKPVDSVPNAASLVAEGKADAFHILLGGIVVGGVTLPSIGVFVWPDCIELDYRMGADWGSAQVVGFFELFRDCCSLATNALVLPAQDEGPPFPDRFKQAWAAFILGSHEGPF